MVYIQDDAARMHEQEFNVPDSPAERLVHTITLICSCLFIIAAGAYLLGAPDGGFKLMLTMGTGGMFIISLIGFFGVIMGDR